jgi:hypothetical protein
LEELMSGETEAAGILPATPQKFKQEIATKITIFERSICWQGGWRF